MLKKFLKFLKGTSSEQDFDGSYLDHLLEQVRPRVQTHLEECPEHDPLLLVVAEILRLTKPGQWTEPLACPLTDDMSPALAAPPPPQPVDASSEGFEIVETSEADDFEDTDGEVEEQADEDEGVLPESDEEAEREAEQETDEGDAHEDDAADDESTGDVEEPEAVTDGVHVDDEALVGAAEMHASALTDSALIDPAPGEPTSLDAKPEALEGVDGDVLEASTFAEIDGHLDENVALDETDSHDEPASSDEEPSDEGPSAEEPSAEEPSDEENSSAEASTSAEESKHLGSPEVLQAGRIFLGLLIENDRLPHDMQLSVAETMLARDLLLGYFVRDDDFDGKVKELLSLVEQKFNEGAFSQARILLQLFQRDRPNQVNNDRNLFYEDMILRLGIRRRHMINNTMLAELEEISSAADLDVGLANAAVWLDENLHIKFHLFTRLPDEAERWREYAAQSRRSGADDVFLRYIPPKRWRPVQTGAQPPTERMLAHVSAATVKRYIMRQLKTCYFVLRAVGDTGLEPFLDVFFDWTESKFDFNSVRLMPLVYRQTMSETQLIDKIFEQAFRRFFQTKTAEYLGGFDEDTILEATRATLDDLAGLDFNRIPPGDYDFGGLVLDRLFEFGYHEPEFAFKLHRLT